MKEAMFEQVNAQKYLDIAGVIFVVINAKQKVTLINKKGCEVLGYLEKEILGKNWFDNFIPESKKDEVRTTFNNLMAGVIEPYEYSENPVLTKSGEERLIAWHNTVITDGSGAIIETLSSGEDITERKRTEEALQESEEKFRTIIENVNVGIYRVAIYKSASGPYGHVIEANPTIAKILGYESTGSFMKASLSDHYHKPEDRQRFIEEMMKKGIVKDREIPMYKKDGTPIWASVTGRAQYDEQGNIKWIDGIVEDITERKRMEEEIRALSLTDALTGLYNRRGLSTLAEQQLKVANRLNSEILVIFADLDGMKWINDNLGHLVGDQALIETTKILKNTFRKSDIIARLGGDEFVVLAFGANYASSDIVIKRMQEQLDFFNAQENRSFKLLISIGTALYEPQSPCSIDELILQADKTMYKHKQNKRGFSL
jgi:diguanylate cyclase (GGDEF)-like protein/PAS domain S-box-containing protein